MPRTYSKTGCTRCKLRKKKCSEERPVCSTCARWNWTCTYDSVVPRDGSSNLSVSLVEFLRGHSVRPLGLATCCDDEMESMVLRDIPDVIKAFYSPTSSSHIQDLQIMWQLMTNNDLLRHAGIACFSVVVQTSDALDQLNRKTYGKALQSLRSKLVGNGLDQENIICVIASIVFLGKMESFGPQSFADALDHWIALIPLLSNDMVVSAMERRALPMSESTLILESLLYHVGTHAMFSQTTSRVWQLWQTNKTYLRLCNLNPEGPNRLKFSPLLSGQYALYDLALQVTYLSRFYCRDHISSNTIDDMEARVRRRDDLLDGDLTVTESATIYTAKCDAERAIYHFFCNSLLICITALKKPSEGQRCQMEELTESGLRMFLDLPVYGNMPLLSIHANHFLLAAIWPILVQGCAAYDTEQFRVFVNHYAKLEPFLDAGHQKRSKTLLDQVSALLRTSHPERESITAAPNSARLLPAGLALLQRRGGVQVLR